MRLKGENILVIGGTGTIGSALVKRLLAYHPNTVRIYSRDEYKQFLMHEDLREYGNIRFLLGDVRDKERLDRSMQDIGIVFDLAALKHVPACEYNPFEAVKTNVLGSQNIIECAVRNRVKRVLYTSSDKAVSPTNTMGATKLLAERLFSSADCSKGGKTPIFSVVRFGNVMDSRGSVIPLWQQQILEKHYITITNPAMTRFMMSISQAVGLIFTAIRLARGGEVFVPKMPVIRLCDLAEAVIELECEKSGLAAGSVEVRETGLRSGEKMYEELMSAHESLSAIEYRKMFVILPHHKLDLMDSYGVRRADAGEYSSNGQEVLPSGEIVHMLKDTAYSCSGIGKGSEPGRHSEHGKGSEPGRHSEPGNCSIPSKCSRAGSGCYKDSGKYRRIGVIIQARTNSTRLPGKVLLPLPLRSGTTVLQQIIRRVRVAAGIDEIIVATTESDNDNIIAEIAGNESAKVFRGSENDVLDRYYQAARIHRLDLIVRITGDCPCIDPRIIEQVVSRLQASSFDYVSNTIERTYPRGLDVEAFSMEALEKAHNEASKPYEREHVTPFIHMNQDSFKCCNITAPDGENNSGIRVTLDTNEDYMLLCSVYDAFPDFDFDAGDIVALFGEKPWLALINSHIAQKSVY